MSTHVSSAERNICVPTALAAVADIPYEEAHEILACAGRRRNGRFRTERWIRYKRPVVNGYEFRRVIGFPQWMTPEEMKRTFSKGHFLVSVNAHVLAVVDGSITDTDPRTRRKIKDVWRAVRVRGFGTRCER